MTFIFVSENQIINVFIIQFLHFYSFLIDISSIAQMSDEVKKVFDTIQYAKLLVGRRS